MSWAGDYTPRPMVALAVPRPTFACLPLILFLAESTAAQEFHVRRVDDDTSAYRGSLSDELPDSVGTVVQIADFSDLSEPGEYYLDVDGVGKSVSFRIGENIYDGELKNAMLGFYGWRSGIDIAFEHDGQKYAHAAGHLDDGLLDYVDERVGEVKDGVGGWYDAGDYGKYLPTASVSVNTMLAAWELFSGRLENVELPFIPEHGSVLPDYLSELKWELDWLLKMTYDDGSGRVHHKLNSPRFPGFVLPEDDTSLRYFSSYSTAATAEFVATMAKAARAFAPFDDATDGYSELLLQAALLSYDYLREHPDNVEYDNSVLSAGAYQKSDVADRLWAAAELWETTGDPDILDDFESRILETTRFVPNFDWDATTNFGLLTYVLSKRDGRDSSIVGQLEKALFDAADEIVERSRMSGYGRGFTLYYWGTNGVVARLCMLLQAAHALKPQADYLDACTAQVEYLYGRNQYNRSQITGSGIEPPQHPHHRPSAADAIEAPYPGLLVGGGQTPTGWADIEADARNNEVAINWNSALVFALAGFVEGNGSTSLGRGPLSSEACEIRLGSIGYLPERAKLATVQRDCSLPTTFDCQLPESTMSGDVTGRASLIDDFEDENTRILERSGRSGGWFIFDDGSEGTRSDLELSPSGRDAGKTAACIQGGDFTRWGGGLGFSLAEVSGARRAYDASPYTGISFWAKGSETRFRAMLVDKYSDPVAGECSGCSDHFQAPFTPSDEWQHFTLTWAEFTQQGFGDRQPHVCPLELRAIQFQWPANAEFELCLDDVAFTSAATEQSSGWTAAGGGCACRIQKVRRPANLPLSLLSVALLALAALVRRHRRRATAREQAGRTGGPIVAYLMRVTHPS